MSRSDRVLAAAAGGAVLLAAMAVFLLLAPTPGASTATALVPGPIMSAPAALSAAPAGSASAGGSLYVDVQGGVAEPGIQELPAGSRVADAIAAAGGYASDADLEASATALNLAKPLSDGEQVRVPRVGDAAAAAAPPSAGAGTPAGGGSGSGLVDLNTATPEELEALPGIGAVTVQKIVAARQERPFASLADAVERGVINRGQLEDIEGLATAG